MICSLRIYDDWNKKKERSWQKNWFVFSLCEYIPNMYNNKYVYLRFANSLKNNFTTLLK